MADDYIVKSMSDAEIRTHASRSLVQLGVDTSRYIDILEILSRCELPTLHGVRRLIFESIEDTEMDGRDAQTVFAKKTVSIQTRFIVCSDAKRNIGRARMTLAHELGHAILHNGPAMARRIVENTIPKYIAAHQSAEHQAKVFAAAILMPDALIGHCNSVEQIASIALVSYDAARIRWELLSAGARRKEFAGKLKSLSMEIRNNSSQGGPQSHYLIDPCPACNRQTLCPIWQKIYCTYCRKTSDGYQDGDSQA